MNSDKKTSVKEIIGFRDEIAKTYVNDLRYEFESEVTRKAWIEFSRHGIKAPRVNVMDIGTMDKAG